VDDSKRRTRRTRVRRSRRIDPDARRAEGLAARRAAGAGLDAIESLPELQEPSPRAKTITVVGIPMDLGQARRGVDMGPSATRYAGLDAQLRRLGYVTANVGNLHIPDRDTLPTDGGAAVLEAAVDACSRIYQEARAAVARGSFPLFLGGDHSLAVGTIAGVTEEEPIGVLWIDAHADMNTHETSPSGNLHGMPLAALLGHGRPELVDVGRAGPKLDPGDVVLIGTRSIDPGERELIRHSGIGVYTMREIDERGVSVVVREALVRLAHRQRLHVSLDMDVLDPGEAPGVGTPVSGGLTYREAHLVMEMIAESERVASAEVVEINPILDNGNRTARLACGLISSLLGKSIL
jgi:arginase